MCAATRGFGLAVALALGAGAPAWAVPASAPSSPVASAGAWLVVVTGIGGDEEHRERFTSLALRLTDAAETRFGLARERIVLLAERPDMAPGRVTGRSTREAVESALRDVGARSEAGDTVVVVLIGHGSARGAEAFFNLPGPDMSAGDFALALDPLAGRRIAFVNTAPSSGPFAPALAGPERVIVTATRSAGERQETLFAGHFVDAFTQEVADLDKDGRVSMLEAFRYATTEVARAYESTGRIRTEHALLEDDGDGEGSEDPSADEGEGALARRLILGAAPGAPTSGEGDEDPEVRALRERRAELEVQLEQLRGRRETMSETEYEDALEELLLEIARIDRQLRDRERTS